MTDESGSPSPPATPGGEAVYPALAALRGLCPRCGARTLFKGITAFAPQCRAAVPRAEECISYGLPAFRLDGKWVVWFGAAANHLSLYGLRDFHKEELKDYDTSGKGTIRFQPDNPLPASLIRKLLKARLAKNATQHRRAAQRPKRRR